MYGSTLSRVLGERCRRALFWGILLAIVFVACELIARAYHYVTVGEEFSRRYASIYEQDRHRCFRLKSNLQYRHRTAEFDVEIHTNAQGIRTDAGRLPLTERKMPEKPRVLFLGPSFTFGWGVRYEDAFPTLTGRKLHKRGRDIEVVNLGTPAQSSLEQLCWLKHSGRRFDPDLIVQTVHVFPFSLASGCPETLRCPLIDDGVLVRSGDGWTQRMVRLFGHSAFIYYGWVVAQWIVGETFGFGVELYEGKLFEQASVETAALRYPAYVARVREYLGRRIPIVFVYLPPPFVAHPEDSIRYLLHTYRMDGREIARSIAAIRRALVDSGAILIDMTPALVKAARHKRMFFRIDTHLTAAGNGVVAAGLENAIEDLLTAWPVRRPE